MSASLVTKLEQEKIKRNRFLIFMSFIIIILALSSVVFIRMLIANEKNEIELHVQSIANQSAATVHTLIEGDFQTLQILADMIAENGGIKDSKELLNFLKNENKKNKFRSMGFILSDGTAYRTDKDSFVNLKNHTFFKETIKGKKYLYNGKDIRNPSVSVMIYTVPIIINGKTDGMVVALHNADILTKAAKITSFNNKAITHIVKDNGEYVLEDNNPDVYHVDNIFEAFMTNYKSLDKLLSGNKSSFWFYDMDEKLKLTAFSPIGYNDWRVMTVLPKNSIGKNTDKLFGFAICFVIILNLIIFITVKYNLNLRKKSNDMIMDLALFDDVTGAFNKTNFYLETEKLLLKYPKENQKCAIIAMDINNFKVVNAIYNMTKGNKVLKDIAGCIDETLGGNGFFGRFSGDQFFIFLKYSNDNDITYITDVITEKLSKFELSVKLIPSYGVFKIEKHDISADIMCDRAIIAKRSIKGSATERTAYFNEDLTKNLLADKEIEDEMYDALSSNQFVMYLQPKFDMQTLKPCGSEALVRWLHPVKGLIPPFKFIPLFERNGFVVNLDRYIWEQACKTIKSWLDEGKEPLPISVNLSRLHFNNPNLVDIIHTLVIKYNIPQKYLQLELTESAFLDNEGIVNDALLKLQNLGFTIAMDDFGTGYSSLNMLRKLPVNVLKLDRGFISEATCSERGIIVLNYIIQMAKALNTSAVCEGIETEEQAEILRKAGCDVAQGFLYAKPMPLNEYEELVYKRAVES